ncbi:MFS transporter [Actinokineospora cianjurensis]|uniref:Putative MFS family arabinose efflux permease n=1 Tax=Actinokineospora cianjurensis TaxID=585224 RepID=A0A421B2Y1_9PSEU|nr:MFS transporter [Actinokineospora cianjurensis]RLK58751.1 putative MFS family arabinose efflux permease [Actinokineospora cianjurensis]
MSHETTKAGYVPAVVMGLGGFIATFDVTAVSLVLSDIGARFEVDLAGSVWVMNGYSLALTIMLITAGVLADRYGHRRSVVLGAALFGLASVACAYAPVYAVLVGGRVLQGVGGSFIVCGGLALVGRLYTEKAERVRAFALIGTIQGSALVVGPGLGGLIASALGWEWIFLVNVPVCAVIIAGCLTARDQPGERKDKPLDVLGLATFSAFLFVATWLLLYGPVIGSTRLSAPLVGAVLVALFAAFVLVERRVRYPAVDLGLFRVRGVVGLALVPLCLAVGYWSLMVYLPLFLESSLGLGLATTSYLMLFFTVPLFAVPYLVTGVATRARQSTFFGGGLAVVAAGCLLIAVGAQLRTLAVVIAGMTIAGIGAATVQNQVTGALIASAPPERAGSIAAVMTILRQGGFAVGSALLVNATNGYPTLFAICVLVTGVGALSTFLLIRSDETRGVTSAVGTG